jgi:hypothetical protein
MDYYFVLPMQLSSYQYLVYVKVSDSIPGQHKKERIKHAHLADLSFEIRPSIAFRNTLIAMHQCIISLVSHTHLLGEPETDFGVEVATSRDSIRPGRDEADCHGG